MGVGSALAASTGAARCESFCVCKGVNTFPFNARLPPGLSHWRHRCKWGSWAALTC